MASTKAFLDDLKSRFRPSDVIGRTVKLKRRGREFIGLSPFTNEKTPSFTVNDEKGFFHCFSSGEHGDVIAFLMKTQRLSFYEAVKQLAEEANLPLPRQSERELLENRQRSTLYDVMKLAAKFYQMELRRGPGLKARSYLEGRGLGSQTIDRFGLGFAPAHSGALRDYLAQKSVDVDSMVKAGLIIEPDDGRRSYDRFRDRIMFPILDGLGRTIAFGGRALAPDQPAKYLNSPETPLFHKGSVLYNLKAAREAYDGSKSPDDCGLVVVEGYMDVIALVDAGIESTVAPLGTAITDAQLGLLWRVAPEPVLCFDGDAAGLAAAYRVVDRALPLLAPGCSLRFALLPEGRDPDDIVRQDGPALLKKILAGSLPLSDMLWQHELGVGAVDTPERRAGLEKRLQGVLASIRDPRIQAHYKSDFRQRLRDLFPGPGRRTTGPNRLPDDSRISQELRRSSLVQGVSTDLQGREGLMVLTIVNHPELLEHHHEGFAGVSLSNLKLDRLRNAIIRVAASQGTLDRIELHNHLSRTGLGEVLKQLQSDSLLRQHSFAGPDADLEEAERGWNHLLLLHRTHALQAELAEAESALASETTEENLARLVMVKSELLAMESRTSDFNDFSEQADSTMVGAADD